MDVDSERVGIPDQSASNDVASTERSRQHCWSALCGEIYLFLQRKAMYRLRVQYPRWFKLMSIVSLFAAVALVLIFFLVVTPALKHTSPVGCRFDDDQLRQSSRMLFLYFACFIVVRILASIPGVDAQTPLIRPETYGACLIKLIVHGPLIIFCAGCFLFAVQLRLTQRCAARSPELYFCFKLYATVSCCVSILFLFLVNWHSKLICEALQKQKKDLRRAPPDTLKKLPTAIYDEAIFGDEEGKIYPAECPICLATWEADDVIKVTPCGHAFHEDCFGGWLKAERTCALCRHDVTKPVPSRPVQHQMPARQQTVPTNSTPWEGEQSSAVTLPQTFGATESPSLAEALPVDVP